MPKLKELTIKMQDQPGNLAYCCGVIADHAVNILAFEVFGHEHEGVAHVVVDNPQEAKKALDASGIRYIEQEVAQTTMPNRPGELSRATAKLGGANINIHYAYCGMDPKSNPILVFGVDDVAKAVALLDELAHEEEQAA
jgi:hypothetical protein